MEVDLVKISKIAGGIAGFIIAIGIIWAFSLSAWENAHGDYVPVKGDTFDEIHADFITVGALIEAFDKQALKKVKKIIRRLEYQQANGGLTERQQWELSDAYDELEDLQ